MCIIIGFRHKVLSHCSIRTWMCASDVCARRMNRLCLNWIGQHHQTSTEWDEHKNIYLAGFCCRRAVVHLLVAEPIFCTLRITSLSLSLGFSSVFSAAVANCLRAIFFIFLSCVRSCYFRYDLTALRFVQYTAHIVFADKPYPNYEIIAYCSKLHFSGLDVFAIVAIIKYRLKHTLTVCCCRYAPCVCTCMGRTVKSIT